MASTKRFELEATQRDDLGKGASRRLRREEKLPGVVYGGGKTPVSLTFAHNKMLKALHDEAIYSHILTLKTNGEAERVILKAVQRHAYKPRLLHIDLQRVRADEKLYMHVPLHFIGGEEAPGFKEAGGMISHIMSDVEVSCFPDHLPEFIELNIADMQLNQILHLSDIKLPSGVDIVALTQGDDKPVVSIHMPRIEVEPVVEVEETVSAAAVPTTEQKNDGEGTEKEEK